MLRKRGAIERRLDRFDRLLVLVALRREDRSGRNVEPLLFLIVADDEASRACRWGGDRLGAVVEAAGRMDEIKLMPAARRACRHRIDELIPIAREHRMTRALFRRQLHPS